MSQAGVRNGYIELKFNGDRTQALASIYPPEKDGESVTVSEVKDRLKTMGVTYGYRDMAILEAIRYGEETGMVANVVVAQGILPQDGKDAKVQYLLPIDLLAQPLPRRKDGLPMPDWFALDPAKMVQPGQELASIVPPQPGIPGKTLTWPIQAVPPKHGKPASLSAGQNVQMIEGTRISATAAGCACLHGEVLTVYGVHRVDGELHGDHTFPAGVAITGGAIQAHIRADAFIAIQGRSIGCRLRAETDILVDYADNCEILTPGNVYVVTGLKNCQVMTRKRVIMLPDAVLVGGNLYAAEGVDIGSAGTPDFQATEVHVGVDRFSEIRNQEIQEELGLCDANIKRISQALQPFASHAAHARLAEDKRALLQKLQAQKRTQDARISTLHTERRSLTLARKENFTAVVTVHGTVWPGVWIQIGEAATQIEVPVSQARFVVAENRKSIDVETLLAAVA